MAESAATLSRPFTPQTFEQRVEQFNKLMDEITRKDLEATQDERRQFIAGVSLRHFRFVYIFILTQNYNFYVYRQYKTKLSFRSRLVV